MAPPRASDGRDQGSVMPMATILIAFLMIGCWALVSAAQQWEARREAHAISASAARAGAQGDLTSLRTGGLFNADTAAARAGTVITAASHTGTTQVDGEQVTVTVTVTVDYAFPAPGFPPTVTATATAIAQPGVTGTEDG